MKKRSMLFIVLLFGIFSVTHAGPIKVVTTISDLKSIAEMIGGDKVSVLLCAP